MRHESHRIADSTHSHGTRKGPRGYVRSDERIFEDICESLIRAQDLDTSMLRITIKDGVVTLQGRVSNRHDKYVVEQIAESARGVRDVDNRLRVSRGGDEDAAHPELRRGIFGTLAREHREVAAMFDDLLSSRGEPLGPRAEGFAALTRELLAHAHAEQEVLYGALAAGMEPEVRKAREEHALVERLILDMATGDGSMAQWRAKLEVLRDLVEHHVRDEEGRFFVEALRAIDPRRSEELDARYASAKEQLRARGREQHARAPQAVEGAGAGGKTRAVNEGGRPRRK